jgi:hypothetical protein
MTFWNSSFLEIHATPRHATPRHAMPCHATPCHTTIRSIPTEFNLTDLVKQFDAYTFVNQLYLEKVAELYEVRCVHSASTSSPNYYQRWFYLQKMWAQMII